MIAAFALAQCSIVVKLVLSAVTRGVFVEINDVHTGFLDETSLHSSAGFCTC